ncbi:Lactate dehydrogenase/glycoside hydrolase, family 4, C-terminal [Cinara cedri]|uniref:Lactate dehydrogenase/glycoside hydrolase, family 4, C-terminal n=1 Tax=Cinara cedri TaxID=506608 RepID=A0A5E4M258_9HEMI|nr:Lactate dehydrogenase/glycoside hydrolase, family 4, C-terminal [Cinara cedri]
MTCTYYIAGVPSCVNFGHGKLVAEKLSRSLPNFSYKIIVKTEEKYQDWLRNFCHEQKWKIDRNPLTWKCISKRPNGACILIGGIDEFFEYLTEYYNVDTRLSKQIKKYIALDNQQRLPLMMTEQIPVQRSEPRKVCITGADYPSTCYLIMELLQLKPLHTEGGITIRLHHKDVNKYGDLMKIKNEINIGEFNDRGHDAVVLVNSIEVGLLKCDLLIVVGDANKEENEPHHTWMNRNYGAMKSLASILNRHCPEYCKVLLTGMELLCFNLSVLAEYAHGVYLYNFVGVTGHHGMGTLPAISRASGVPIPELHCPPVWGFVGSNKYIDVNNVVYHCDSGATTTMVPNTRTPSKNHKYLRNVLLLSTGVADTVDDDGSCNQYTQITRHYPLSCLPEVRAAVRLISEWFDNEDNDRVTISAAVFSDGTFGLPFGMFMSQPVCIENGEWKPNFDFPDPVGNIISDIVSNVTEILIEFNLRKRFTTNWKESMSQIISDNNGGL